MKNLREQPPVSLGGQDIVSIGDYRKGFFTNLSTGEQTPTGQPESDVLSFVLKNGDKVIIRPSGTEPKIKIYYLVGAESDGAAGEAIAAYERDASHFADA